LRPVFDSTTGSLVLNAGRDATTALFMLHHAGGSASAMLPLARQLPSTVEVRMFELAGRGARYKQQPAATFALARDDLLDKVRRALDRPTVLLGHSLGGLLADSIARLLPAARRDLVRKVVVSACPSPRTAVTPQPRPARRSEQCLRYELVRHGGAPPELLESPELLDHAVTILGNDMLLVDSAAGEPLPPPAPLDYEIWMGRGDPTIDPGEAERWSRVLARPPVIRTFDGGHFYLFDESGPGGAALRGVVADHDRPSLDDRPARPTRRDSTLR
jgi:surfactin synthase thioesterase subunit